MASGMAQPCFTFHLAIAMYDVIWKKYGYGWRHGGTDWLGAKVQSWYNRYKINPGKVCRHWLSKSCVGGHTTSWNNSAVSTSWFANLKSVVPDKEGGRIYKPVSSVWLYDWASRRGKTITPHILSNKRHETQFRMQVFGSYTSPLSHFLEIKSLSSQIDTNKTPRNNQGNWSSHSHICLSTKIIYSKYQKSKKKGVKIYFHNWTKWCKNTYGKLRIPETERNAIQLHNPRLLRNKLARTSN